MLGLSQKDRKLLLTFLAAGVAAVITEHALKPGLKRRLRV